MKIYLGLVSRGSKKAKEIRKEGWGVVVVPELRKKFCPETFPLYFVDNGAFVFWKRGLPFDEKPFLKTLDQVSEIVEKFGVLPSFVVVPDLVAQGLKSLDFSLLWLERLKREFLQFPYALALQDGMEPEYIETVIDEFDYLFVGGTLRWKVRTGETWVRLAHQHRKKCHIGRVGTAKRVRWARRIGADSIDSALPLFSKEKFEAFRRALHSPLLPELPFVEV
jgi:hypothetical protein